MQPYEADPQKIWTIIRMAEKHFTVKHPDAEVWFVGVGNVNVDEDGREYRYTSDAVKDAEAAGAHCGIVVSILLPKTKTPREKLIRELRRAAKFQDEGSEELAELLKRAADELAKESEGK